MFKIFHKGESDRGRGCKDKTYRSKSDKAGVRGKRAVWVSVGALVLSVFLAPGPVFAKSSTHSASFPNGAMLTADAWIQSVSDWKGCGYWRTSIKITPGSRPEWIKNKTSFYEINLNPLSLFGVGGMTVNGESKKTLEWTNSNGADGSYLKGNVCGGFGAVYVGLDLAGSAFHYGNVVFVNARI